MNIELVKSKLEELKAKINLLETKTNQADSDKITIQLYRDLMFSLELMKDSLDSSLRDVEER